MEKKRRAWTVNWEYNKVSQVLANPFAIVNTAKAHASVYRMREQAAVFTCECLCEWLNSRDFQESCRMLFLICIRLQRYLFSFTSRHFFENILRTHRKLYV